MIRLYLHKGHLSWANPKDWGTLLITVGTDSPYFHVGAAYDKNCIIEATTKRGVDIRPYHYYQKLVYNDFREIDVYEVTAEIDEDQFIRELLFNVDKKYDFKGVIYLAWLKITGQRNKANVWAEKNDFFCSELIIRCLRKAALSPCFQDCFLFRVETNNKLRFWTQSSTPANEFSETANAVITDNQWHQVGFRFDGTAGDDKVDIFVDGVSQTISTTDDDSFVVANTAAEVRFGISNYTPSDPMNGLMTECAFWIGIELTDAEFALLGKSRVKRMPLQIQPSYLKIYLPMDDYTEGTVLGSLTFKDYSGNGNDANDVDTNGSSSVIAEQVLSYP